MAETVEGLEIGGALMRLREYRGLSRQEAADAMGSTPSSLWRIETSSREPRLEMLVRMAAALGGRIVIDPSGISVGHTRMPRSRETAAA
jgi:transcriptional regulator with XRE-family HTH domain